MTTQILLWVEKKILLPVEFFYARIDFKIRLVEKKREKKFGNFLKKGYTESAKRGGTIF